MHNLLMDKACLSQLFLSFEPLHALKVKQNIDAVFECLSLPSETLLIEMAKQGIQLPTSQIATNKLDIERINMSVLHTHLSTLFLDKHKLFQTINEFPLAEKVAIREQLQSLMSLLHLPSKELIDKMQDEGILSSLLNDEDKAQAVKANIAAFSSLSEQQKDSKLHDVKQRLAELSEIKKHPTDEVKVARVKANLMRVRNEKSSVKPQSQDSLSKIG